MTYPTWTHSATHANLNNLNIVWEPNDRANDLIIINSIVQKITSLIEKRNYSNCKNYSITLSDISNENIIELLKNNFIYSLNPNEYYLITRESEIFSQLKIVNRNKYSSINFVLYYSNEKDILNFEKNINEIFKDNILSEDMMNIVWYTTSKNESTSYFDVEEIYTDKIYKEAYPYIPNFDEYISNFIDSDEQLLILIGPPGTGKSRLIRYLLYKLIKSYPNQLGKSILYTNDQDTLENDMIYIDFLTRECLALVAEDVDNHLKDRTGGSNAIHRILNAADGLIRGYNRKILLSTNLPNTKNIDEALLRPGRCYGVINTRLLDFEESLSFLNKISNNDYSNIIEKNKEYSLAKLYQISKNK